MFWFSFRVGGGRTPPGFPIHLCPTPLVAAAPNHPMLGIHLVDRGLIAVATGRLSRAAFCIGFAQPFVCGNQVAVNLPNVKPLGQRASQQLEWGRK